MEKVILFFETKIATPRPWGAYHLCCMCVLVACVALLVGFGKKLRANPKAVRRMTAAAGVFLIAIEILKQVFYGLHVGENGIYWDYPWWVFPLQMCSTPMYVCFALLFFREGRIQRALCSYLGTFGMFGGEPQALTLRFSQNLAGVVLDRFGKDVALVPHPDSGTFTVHVSAVVSPQFMGWLAGFGKEAKLEAPAEVAAQFTAWCRDILAQY